MAICLAVADRLKLRRCRGSIWRDDNRELYVDQDPGEVREACMGGLVYLAVRLGEVSSKEGYNLMIALEKALKGRLISDANDHDGFTFQQFADIL